MSVELATVDGGVDGSGGAYPSGSQPSLRPPIPPRPEALEKGGAAPPSYPASTTVPGSSAASSSSPSAFEDPYEVARRTNPWRYRYYRYVNPWCRMLLIFITLYLYAMSSGVLTYRNNDFQDQMQRLVNQQPNPNDPTATIPGDPSSTRPEREADVTDVTSIARTHTRTHTDAHRQRRTDNRHTRHSSRARTVQCCDAH